LHRKTSVKDDIHQTLDGQDISNSSQSRILSQRMSRKSTTRLNQPLGLHILKRSLLHQRQRRLRKLRRRQQTRGRNKLVERGILIDTLENGDDFADAVGIDLFVHHVEVILTDCLALGTAKVDGEFLGIVSHNVDDGEAVVGEEMFVCAVPDGPCHGTRFVQVHAHA
jgi:hypothetical protein